MVKFPNSLLNLQNDFKYFSCMLDGFKTNSWNQGIFYFIFIIRRSLISVLIIYSNAIIQTFLSISITLSVSFIQIAVYIAAIKPFVNSRKNYVFVINELILLSFYLIILLNELGFYHENQEKLAVYEVRTVLVALVFNASVNTIQSIESIISKIKSRFFNRSSRIAPISTTQIDVQGTKPIP